MASQQKHNANQARETVAKRRPHQPAARTPAIAPQTPALDALERAIEAPESAAPGDILGLQRTAGNRAVSGLLQTKLRVGPVGDAYEQEADRVADQVMRMPSAEGAPASATTAHVQRQEMDEEEILQGKPLAATITPVVQRQELEEEEFLQGKALVQRQDEEELLQGKALVQRQEEDELLQGKPLVQRQEVEEEELLQGKSLVQRQEMEDEELLQGKSLVQRQAKEEELVQSKALAQRQELDEDDLGQRKPLVQRQTRGSFRASDDVERRLASSHGGGNPLPRHLLADMEARFGNNFSTVRVHTGGEAEQLNRDLSARAFTHGNDIYMGASQYSPDSTEGQRLLAHELTHVVQQTGYRKPTPSAKMDNGNKSTFKVQTLQRVTVVQRDTVDNSWADLLPREKQALQALGFNAGGVRFLPQRGRVRPLPQSWDRFTPEERTPIFQQAQQLLKQTQTLKGLGEKGGDVSGLTAWDHFDDYHDLLNGAGITAENIEDRRTEAQDLVQRYKAWAEIDEDAKLELGEKFGISTPEDFAKVPRSRAEEVQQILDNAKTQKEEKEQQEELTKKPSYGEIAGEGWRALGTSIKRGFRSYVLGAGLSSSRAKRRFYGRKRLQYFESRRGGRGRYTTGRQSLRARPAPKPKAPSGPSGEDIKNLMYAVKAIQSSTLRNKNDIVTALLEKAGMV